MKGLKMPLAICVVLLVMQSAFLVFPDILLFNRLFRPAVYGIIAVWVFVCFGSDKRPIRKTFEANIAAGIFLVIYGIMVFLLMYWFGYARTRLTSHIPYNIFALGVVVFCGEYIRYKLLKYAKNDEKMKLAILITAVYTIAQLNDLQPLLSGIMRLTDFIFASLFFTVVLNMTVTYFAIYGSFFLVFSFSFIFSAGFTILPFLPHLERTPLMLISTFIVAICALIFHMIMQDTDSGVKQRERHAMKYQKKSRGMIVLTTGSIALLFAFFAGLLPIYPTIILTSSMEPNIPRASLVFIERVSADNVLDLVEQGLPIHYRNPRNPREYVHRVIDFRYNTDGQRTFITQGDANPTADSWPVEQEYVLGIPRMQIPYIGYPYLFLRAILGLQ